MKLPIIVLSAILLTSCSGGGLSTSSENSYVSGNGSAVFINESDRREAPKFSGETLTTGAITLSSNKVSVINVWASWCAPCRAEAPLLQEFSIQYPQVQFAGVLSWKRPSAPRLPYTSSVDIW